MVSNELGACEWFVWDLRRSGLIDRGQLDQIVGEFLKRNPRAEAPALAEYLVHQGTLTPFQAERVLTGKTQGLVLGPYVLLDAIGQGSMGQVYKAASKNDSQLYAVKVLPRRSMWNVRLARRQVRSFGQFSHPAVVPFVDVGTAGGLHYLAWPLAEGATLETLVTQNGKLSVEQAALLGVQVAQGLTVAHQNNLFHGLVKPSNILIGADNQARILDFGIGSLLVENEGESLVDTMSTANTLTSGLDCASPESILEPTNRTPAGDQYSLGCTLYYCLTGRFPFPDGSAVEKMMAHQMQEPTPIKELAPDVPDAVVEVVKKLMAKKPEDRFSGCDEVVEALEPHLGELAAVAAEAAATGSPRSGLGGSRLGFKSGSSGRMPGLPAGVATPPPAAGSRFGPLPQPPLPAPPATVFPPRGPLPQPPAVPAAARGSSHLGTLPAAARGSSHLGTLPAAARGSSRLGTLPAGGPAPVRSSGVLFPGRSAIQAPAPVEEEVPLEAVTPPPFADPERGETPGGWVPGGEEPRQAFGTVGVIAATVLLMVLVYFGARMVMGG